MSAIPANANVTIINKNEKKAREVITKLGLKKVEGIIRVAFRKKNNEIIAIEKPTVYRSAGGNYVVFGEPKKDDFTQRLAEAQKQMEETGMADTTGDKSPADIQADMANAASTSAPEAAADAAEEDLDAGDLSNDDIELVMQQANVTKGKAIKALKEHNGDIVNAIMSLSK